MKIIWSKQAKKSYEKIIDNLLEEWPFDIALKFENLTNSTLDNIKNNKSLCPKSQQTQLRKCIIHKNVSLIYRIEKSNIELVTFIDNRSEHQY
jgi:mRNA-degrading endonuclease YafQ of YafQ-DinJ toxin-antitoxin module